MRRYTFLLLAFFLAMSSVHAIGISLPSINMAPNSTANVSDAPSKKELRAPMGSYKKSSQSVLIASSCRSGREKGQSGCVEKIKTDRNRLEQQNKK